MGMLKKQICMIQLQQNRLQAANCLLTQIQMNYLLSNDEAECGVNPNSEDLGKYEIVMFTYLRR